MPKNIRSFTLIEIIIVIVLIGILTAFALPYYGKASAKSDERMAITFLMGLRSEVIIYLTNSGVATIPVCTTKLQFKNNLGVSILASKMTYGCWGVSGGDTNICSATHPMGWVLEFHLNGPHNTDGSIHCTDTTCPSCPEGGSGNCG